MHRNRQCDRGGLCQKRPDFDFKRFAQNQRDPSVLRQLEVAQTRTRPTPEKKLRPSVLLRHSRPFENREISDHNRIDDWFSESRKLPLSGGLAPKAKPFVAFARGLGGLKAKLHVLEEPIPTLPAGSVRPGIFGESGQIFDAILRYSTSGGPRFESMPDDDADQAVGLGLKVLTKRGKTAHDLLFINSPVFMTNDPVELVFQEDASALRDSYAAARDEAVQQVLNEVQYTASAFRWGETAAVKYRLRPIQDAVSALPDDHRERYEEILQSRGSRCLEEALSLVVETANHHLEFNLEIQFSDPDDARSHGCPVDDERIDWKSPWYCVAQLTVEAQNPSMGGTCVQSLPRLLRFTFTTWAFKSCPAQRLRKQSTGPARTESGGHRILTRVRFPKRSRWSEAAPPGWRRHWHWRVLDTRLMYSKNFQPWVVMPAPKIFYPASTGVILPLEHFANGSGQTFGPFFKKLAWSPFPTVRPKIGSILLLRAGLPPTATKYSAAPW